MEIAGLCINMKGEGDDEVQYVIGGATWYKVSWDGIGLNYGACYFTMYFLRVYTYFIANELRNMTFCNSTYFAENMSCGMKYFITVLRIRSTV